MAGWRLLWQHQSICDWFSMKILCSLYPKKININELHIPVRSGNCSTLCQNSGGIQDRRQSIPSKLSVSICMGSIRIFNYRWWFHFTHYFFSMNNTLFSYNFLLFQVISESYNSHYYCFSSVVLCGSGVFVCALMGPWVYIRNIKFAVSLACT
jgi:hypothetical protein